MSRLNTAPNLGDPDAIYEALVGLHRDLAPDQSRLVNAKLILLLANHIGDSDVIHEAMAKARNGVERGMEQGAGDERDG